MRSNLPLRALLLSTSILAACAAQPPAPPSATTAVAASQSDAICSKEYPTGSNIAVTKCRTREQVEAERAAAERGMGRAQTGGPNAKMGGG